jgi:mannosyltransferase
VSFTEVVTSPPSDSVAVDEVSCTAAARRAKYLRRAAILLILILAAALRFHHIGAQSLWADEGLTARILRLPAAEMLGRIRDWEQTPPLYYYLIKPYVAVFGSAESTLRYPSALFGTLSVFALYCSLRRSFNTVAGLTAAVLLALSPYHIAYSQEARAYALFVLLTIVSCDLFMRVITRRTHNLEVLYILSTALLLYTHLYGIFIVAAQNVAYLIAWFANRLRLYRELDLCKHVRPCAGCHPEVLRRIWLRIFAGRSFGVPQDDNDSPSPRPITHSDLKPSEDSIPAPPPPPLPLKRWLTLNLVVLILYSAFLKTIWIWYRTVQTGFWVKKVTLDDISQAYEIYAGSVPLLIAPLSLAVIGIWRARGRDRVASMLWLGVMILPIFVPVIVSVLTHPTFSSRYGMPASLGLYALAAAGVASLGKLSLQVPTAILLAALSVLPTNIPDPKPQWREAARFLETHMRQGDFAAINRKGAAQTMYDYYVHRPDVRRIGFDGAALPVTQPLPDDKHIWLILYTCDIPPKLMLNRGSWQVGHQKLLREILILELYDSPEAATRPTPTF